MPGPVFGQYELGAPAPDIDYQFFAVRALVSRP